MLLGPACEVFRGLLIAFFLAELLQHRRPEAVIGLS